MSHFKRCRLGRVVAALAGTLVLMSSPLAAQQKGTIHGTVVEASSARPMGGVQVVVQGTDVGAVTSASGEYRITGVPTGQHTVRAEMIGFSAAEQTATVAAGQTAEANFSLSQQALSLDEIVVTGTPGATSKRKLGNSIAKIDAATITKETNVTNMTELLQSKTPGLQLLPNSGVAGTAADIQIRGAGSLINNKPVIYIDGIRYNTDDYGTFSPSGAGATGYTGQVTSALNGLDPNDIESIEVIKGPAAATLYGSDAANGVIQIITKKGTAGEQSLQWNARVEYGHNDWALDIPDNYTRCDAVKLADPATWPGCAGQPAGTVLRGNPLRDDPDALRTGAIKHESLSLRGGGENYSFYVAGDNSEEQGVFLNNYNNRRSVRANFMFQPTQQFDFTINTNYIKGKMRLPVGDESAQGMLLSAFRGKPGRIPPAGNERSIGWGTTNPVQANAYDNTTASDRLTLGATTNYNPFSWFRNRLTVGLDFTSSLAQILSLPGSTDAEYAGVPDGLVAQRSPRNYIYTVDYAGNLEKALTSDLNATTSFGMQYTSKHYEALYARGVGLGAPTVTEIGKAQNTVGDNGFSDWRTLGFFGQEQLGWKDRLFVTGAVRMDNSSVFGDQIKRILYPKASVAYVASEEPALASLFRSAHIDNFKFRAAWGQAGQAPAPFTAAQTYTVGKVILADGSVGSALRTLAYGNENLKPERGSELEVGFDAGALNGRLGLEFTYYNKQMNDALVSLPVAYSTGFISSQYVNIGKTKNSGFEVGLSGTPVQSKAFVWDANLNLSTNKNELVSFGDPSLEKIAIGGASYTPGYQQHRPGYPLAGWWLPEPERNADGTPVMNGAAVVMDTATYQGSAIPTREIGFSNTFTIFRDFRVFALFDYKGGFKVFNYKAYNRCRFQDNCERMSDASNIDLATGDVVNPEVYVWRQVPAAYLEDGTFVKLRDLSLTYSLPTRFAQRMHADAASLTFAGHNLALWSGYSGIDPEVNGYGNRDFVRADVYAVPMIQRVTMSLNLTF